MINLTTYSKTSAFIGIIIWLALFGVTLQEGILGMIAHLLLFAILGFVPLLLLLVASWEKSREGQHWLAYRAALLLQPIAALLVLLSYWLPTGLPAALLTSPWLLLTGLVALFGMGRFLSRTNKLQAEELCLEAGLLFLPVGGVWLFLSRWGVNPLGFGAIIVLLTAVHFHYAAFAAPILASMTGRKLLTIGSPAWTKPAFAYVTVGIISGMPLVAAGITFSFTLEVIAASFLASTLFVLGLLTLFVIVPTIRPRLAQSLLALSSMTLLFTMLLASGYGIGRYTGAFSLTIPQMVQLHGWGNALFVLTGVVGWLAEGENENTDDLDEAD